MNMKMPLFAIAGMCLLSSCDEMLEFSPPEDMILCVPKCDPGMVCHAGQCIPNPLACNDNELSCDGKQPVICSERAWIKRGPVCPTRCEDGLCIMAGESCSSNNISKCVNNPKNNTGSVYTCNNLVWKIDHDCDAGRACKSESETQFPNIVCGECVEGSIDGDKICLNGKLQPIKK